MKMHELISVFPNMVVYNDGIKMTVLSSKRTRSFHNTCTYEKISMTMSLTEKKVLILSLFEKKNPNLEYDLHTDLYLESCSC